jgi:predicted PurR-regulated permease PerM
MAFPDRRTADILLTILLFAVVLAIVYVARGVIVIFAFAILFAYLINPIVQFLQRHSLFFKNLRGPHVLEAYLALLIFIALVAYGLAPGILGQTGKVFKQIPALMDGLSTGEIVTQMGSKYGWTDAQELRLKSLLVQHQSEIQRFARTLEFSTPTVIAELILIPILAIFFLSYGANIANSLIPLVSTRNNLEAVQSLVGDLNVMFQHYIRAKVIIGGLSFIFYSAAMLVLGFPHAIGLGLLGGILEFIPAAGWIISAITISSVGVLTHAHWIRMAALLGVWRLLMDYWIAPRVMGHELEIHPLLAIFTLMVGGAIGGIVGVYLSVPLVAALRLILRSPVINPAPSSASPPLK